MHHDANTYNTDSNILNRVELNFPRLKRQEQPYNHGW